ncbi:hypothetical protein V1277_006276 [Bradyrhizobium sp. AZCC 1588]|uniref:hypothetical protein n=1 Tax=unclassified Bradyrhizobium TaxID=2631580 RepID=UPI002FF417D7
MNKAVTPKQLELTAGKSTEDLLKMSAPHIDFEGAAFKESLKGLDKIEKEEAARAVLGMNEVETKVRSTANSILASVGLPPKDFDDFDWSTDDSVILHEQKATAVYHNKFGGLVIRQEKAWDEESDPYVVISADNAVTFMEALAKRARE